MAELKNCRDKARVSTAICRRELLQEQKNLVAALEKVKFSLVCAAAMKKDRNAVSTKYEELRSRLEERVGLANKEKPRFEAEVVKVTQEQDASLAMAKKLALEIQRFNAFQVFWMRRSSCESACCPSRLPRVSRSQKSANRRQQGLNGRRLMLRTRWRKLVRTCMLETPVWWNWGLERWSWENS